jgi:hypothetical protein
VMCANERALLLCAFILLGGTASFQVFGADGDEHCPILPEGSGYVWQWVFHVDAGYCIGRDAKSHKEAFEFAIVRLNGVMPSDLVDRETSFVKSGSVGGTPVRWYRAPRHGGPEKLEYRTFTLLNEENEAYIEVNVYAPSESQMNERLKVLERLKYR